MADRDERYYRSCLEHYHVSRRGLFRGLFGGVKKSQPQQQMTVIRTVARPPTALDEALFVALCNSCKACEQICPQQVIEWGSDNKPQLNLDYNHCSQCGQCQQACPTKALSAEKADTEYRPLFSAGCLNRVSGQCQTCVEQCPQQALTIHDNQQPQLDSSRCDGCGLCRASCYIGAVTLRLVG